MLTSYIISNEDGNSVAINDGVYFLTPFFNTEDQAQADIRLQKLSFRPPVYTGQTWGDKTFTIKIFVLAKTGDSNYVDFDLQLAKLKKVFDIRGQRSQGLTTFRMQKYGDIAKVVYGTTKSFLVNRKERTVDIQYTVLDAIWKSETESSKIFSVTSSGQRLNIHSTGNVDTTPTLNIEWNVTKVSTNTTGNYWKYQIPVKVTNNSLNAVSRFPIELTGYAFPPQFTLGTVSGSLSSGTYSVKVSAIRYRPDGSLGNTGVSPTITTIPITTSQGISVTILNTVDVAGYRVYVSTVVGSEKLQTTYYSPVSFSATTTINITTYDASGATASSTNLTGWDTTQLVSSGKMHADGSDVRVLIGNIPAPCIVVAPNTTNTRVWCILDMGALLTETVYLQYGNTATVIPLTFPASDNPILDTVNSNNQYWTWTTFSDYLHITRPGSWSAVQKMGVGYGWKQDNQIVRKGSTTRFVDMTNPLINGTFITGSIAPWTSNDANTTIDTFNLRPGTKDQNSLKHNPQVPNTTIEQIVTVQIGVELRLDAWAWADVKESGYLQVVDSNNGTLARTAVGGNSSWEFISLKCLPSTTSTVKVHLYCATPGLFRLDDVSLYPNTNSANQKPLTDAHDSAEVMGLLHSSVAINNREVPLNGWEIAHPAGIYSISHYGITALRGSEVENNNVLRLIAEDTSRAPTVVWGQPNITQGGPVYYATSNSPLVHILNPTRQTVRFEINTSIQDDVNDDGTFAAILGTSLLPNPQYAPSISFGRVQSFYDLNCTIIDTLTDTGISIATPLEPQSSLLIDPQTKSVWYTDPNGLKTLRTSALSVIGGLRPEWLEIHAGDNTYIYSEDVVGGVTITFKWREAYN